MRILSYWVAALLWLGSTATTTFAEESKREKDGLLFDTVGEARGIDVAVGIARWDRSKGRRQLTLEEFAQSAFDAMVAGPLYGEKREPPEKYALRPLTELLLKTKIRRATIVARNYQQMGAFGGTWQEGVHTFEFEEPLGEVAEALIAWLRDMGGEERTIAGQKVLVADWRFEKENYLPQAKWEAFVVVQPNAQAKSLIYATSSVALEDYLESKAHELVAEVKKTPQLLAGETIDTWVASLDPEQEEASPPKVEFLMAWSTTAKLSKFDMAFYPAVKDKAELVRRHRLLDMVVDGPPKEENSAPSLADIELQSVEGGSHLQLEFPRLDDEDYDNWSEEEKRREGTKMGIGLFVANLLLERNR